MPRRAARVTLGALAVIVLAVAVVRGPGVAERAWDQFTTPRAAATTSDPAERLGSLSGTRYLVWDTALDTGAEHPWEGTGAGTFEFAWNQAGRDPEHVRDGHSFWLEAWAELGIPGVLATLALAAALLWAAVRARVRVAEPGFGAAVGVLAALLLTAFHASLDWIWESTANTTLALALAAAAAASLSAPVLPRAAFAFRAAAGLAALVLVLVQLPPVVGTSRIRDSQAAAARGDDREALAAADDAVAIQPWAASPYVQRGLLLERAGALRAAEVDLRRAYRREPKDWRHPLLLARVLAEQGRARAAVEAFREARKLRPRSARLNPPPPTG
jgi:tetratricopeptide (TPR) repeat protein